MDEEDSAALEGSIKKWEEIVAGTGVDECFENCPLCALENSRCTDDDEDCNGCVVKNRTGKSQCDGTPWEEWNEHQHTHLGNVWPYRVKCDECARLAQAELDFLKSLRED